MRVAHAVADPDRLRGRPPGPRPDPPGDHRHGVGVVEEQPLGTPLGHLVGHLDHHGDRAETAHDAADPDRVGDRLPQPVAPRDLEVANGRLVSPDLDLVDQVVGALEGGRAVRVCRDHVAGVQPSDDLVRRTLRVPQPLVVDVVQRELERPGELRVRTEVRQDVPCELHAAGADDRDLRHGAESRLRRCIDRGSETRARCRAST